MQFIIALLLLTFTTPLLGTKFNGNVQDFFIHFNLYVKPASMALFFSLKIPSERRKPT